jgi:hypothetical protein
MSLKSFLALPDVREKVRPLRPKAAGRIPAPLRVPPRSSRWALVGTAFDYLLRFELQRRAPHAVAERWVAEAAPDVIWQGNEYETLSWLHLSRDATGAVRQAVGPDARAGADPGLAREVAGHARAVVERARSAHAAYLKSKSPTRPERADLAAHALRLAKLDALCRAWQFDPTFDSAAPEDVEDLLALLEVVPFDQLLHEKVMLLNPTFGPTSRLVGGADADLITGETIVDFKTTKKQEVDGEHLDQLLGYYLLARRQRGVDPRFPAVRRLAIYFCRHGHLFALDAAAWTEHPLFQETEQWFFERAQVAFGPVLSGPARRPSVPTTGGRPSAKRGRPGRGKG